MSSDNTFYGFTKENLDTYLKELGKEYRKLNGKAMPAEIILVGGAAILAKYGFRNNTIDIDAVIHASFAMKEAINKVGDNNGLPNNWINADFQKTASFSPKLAEVSIYYRTFSNVLTIRVVTAEYLIAMKLCASRKYKHDLSDIIGLLDEHEKAGVPITLQQIEDAITLIYGNKDAVPESSYNFLKLALDKKSKDFYDEISKEEKKTLNNLKEFNKKYPKTLTNDNIDDITAALEKRKNDK